jgi:nucleotide-binding universal stress UspA family protein
LLDDLASTACARQPGVSVTTLISEGSPADALIDASVESDLLVVGTRGCGRSPFSTLGSVSHRVATNAHCPVAVVPEQSLALGDGPSPRIVVGVSATGAGRLALEFALEEAQRRNGIVVAVRAWGEPDTSLVRVPDSTAIDRWKEHANELLQGDLERLSDRYPGIQIEPVLVAEEPADALIHEAQDAVLVVVGCHRSSARWGTGLGPVPSAIMHRALCPVVVVGQGHQVNVELLGS